MKKLISVILALVMVLSLAACGGSKAPETTAPATEAPATEAPVSGLADAVAYVKTIYKTAEGTVTGKDYQVVGSVPVGAETYEITWTVDVTEDLVTIVKGEDGLVTIDVNEGSSEEVAYVLTASLTDGTETKTLSWNHILPATMDVDGLTYAEIVALAYALEDQQATEDAYRLFGTVTSSTPHGARTTRTSPSPLLLPAVKTSPSSATA